MVLIIASYNLSNLLELGSTPREDNVFPVIPVPDTGG